MTHLDLFSGIGGFALAASWVWPAHSVAAFCEKDEWCRRILQKHWPQAPIIEDIRDLDGTTYANVDLLTGGFPCQPFSNAGQQRGTEDDRHLWPEMLRVIREARPRFVVGENVYGLVTMQGGLVFETVLSDLEAEGYEAWALVLPAAGVDAPHRRDRVWIVAHYGSIRCNTGRATQSLQGARVDGQAPMAHAPGERVNRKYRNTEVARSLRASGFAQPNSRSEAAMGNADGTGPPERPGERSHARAQQPTAERTGLPLRRNGQPEPGLGRGDDGLPARMDPYAGGWPLGEWERSIPRVASGVPDRTNRLKALGNAIVPQVAARIFEALRDAD